MTGGKTKKKSTNKRIPKNRAWVVSVNMGYGHQRAVAPFGHIAQGGDVVTANDYAGIPESDQKMWEQSRQFYEMISRAKQLPLIGEQLFDWYDKAFQQIAPFYPKRDLSKPTIQLRQMYRLMDNGWGKHLIDKLNRQQSGTPLLTSFFVTAFFAEQHDYQGDIYCLATDTDISRVWAPLNPHATRIKYLAPTRRAKERLELYGIPADQVILTGFPLPVDNIGGADLTVIKEDLWQRVHHLDPRHAFIDKYEESLEHYLGTDPHTCENGSCHVRIMFAVGGAGAQREIGITIARSLKDILRRGEMELTLVAGIRPEVRDYFTNQLKHLGLSSVIGKHVHVLYKPKKADYFTAFNQALRRTDILWTKPSELAFFTGLGVPVIMAPPIGSQEVFNKRWLQSIGGGIPQLNPKYAHQWLPDWLDSGWLAEAALEGFLDAPKFGTYKVEAQLFGKEFKQEGRVALL